MPRNPRISPIFKPIPKHYGDYKVILKMMEASLPILNAKYHAGVRSFIEDLRESMSHKDFTAFDFNAGGNNNDSAGWSIGLAAIDHWRYKGVYPPLTSQWPQL